MTTTDTETIMPTPTPETDEEAAVRVKRFVMHLQTLNYDQLCTLMAWCWLEAARKLKD